MMKYQHGVCHHLQRASSFSHLVVSGGCLIPPPSIFTKGVCLDRQNLITKKNRSRLSTPLCFNALSSIKQFLFLKFSPNWIVVYMYAGLRYLSNFDGIKQKAPTFSPVIIITRYRLVLLSARGLWAILPSGPVNNYKFDSSRHRH